MHLVPLALGILAIVVGVAMVAFGVPINEFGTGNTLIAAGTTAIVGGFILLGVWAAMRQLQRLIAALEPRSPGASGRAAAQRPGAAPAPQREPRIAPEELPEREPPHHDAEEAARRPWPEEVSQPRMRERAAIDEHVPVPEQIPARESESSWELFAPRSASSPREHSFESIWPSDRPARDRREAHPGDRDQAEERSPEPGSAPESAPQPATILKSGVINGMAYTLYTDGSIEAELPQGTLRFGSLDELRDYLARNT